MNERTLLQETVRRAHRACGPLPLVIGCDQHRFVIAEQLREIGMDGCPIVLEPVGRNTCAAAAIAALWVQKRDPNGVVLLLPSDQFVGDDGAFGESVQCASIAASLGYIVTFGLLPTAPETGFGYVRKGESIDGADGCMKVSKFIEKPDHITAQKLIDSGDCLWNGGMFAFLPQVFLDELERYEPAVLQAARTALSNAVADLDFIRLDKGQYSKAPSISIDYAVMERTAKAAVCELKSPWGDLGSWRSVWEFSQPDERGNVVQGDALLEGTRNSFVHSFGALTAVLGLEDVVVVSTGDSVLVTTKEKSQDVRTIVSRLNESGRTEHKEGRLSFRPWGQFEKLGKGDRFQVKLITLKPGAGISLQKHHMRAEHWVVVKGVARVTRNEEVFQLQENESVFIPVGTVHRLENTSTSPLQIVEVQTGTYLGEDDIVRIEDRYGRGKS